MRSPEANDELIAAIRQARACPELLRELSELYADVDAELVGQDSPCNACGQCCNLDRYGLRLFVTPAEAAMLGRLPPQPSPLGADGKGAASAGQCPYLVGDKCSARDRRTLGCRIFFCRADQNIGNVQYERFHARIQALHAAHDIPYFYANLFSALHA
jgi:Fe-S-cluster containining protein